MAERRQKVAMFERRILTISVVPLVQTVAEDDCGSLTCGYCSGGCTNCTATCRGAASTKHLQVFDPLEEVALDKEAILKMLTEMVESISERQT